MLVKLPRMKKEEITELINKQNLCRIAFKGTDYPYMAPFQYTYFNNTFYFHFTDYGKKMKLLEKDNRVCIEIERYTPNLSQYNFVVIRGRLGVVKDPSERAKAIRNLAEEGKNRISTNFLAAHGLKKEEGWSTFVPEKPLVIIKLKEIVEIIGLKSP
ncbi:MAG: pyridoxamine 5'-phosphate oxidase family protein [Candidatus Ranarchaeia archaeon]|jgi:nitroimidazol reductase NimA-like FMN-containing flavoprotein (pyridoxamine 5'-phosphate oxidase superfamily)